MRSVFSQIGIGYRVLGGIKFYERAEIKDAVSYLRIVNQKFDDLALERVIGTQSEVLEIIVLIKSTLSVKRIN